MGFVLKRRMYTSWNGNGSQCWRNRKCFTRRHMSQRKKPPAVSISGPFCLSEHCPGSLTTPPGTKVLSSGLCDLQQRQHQVTNRAVRLERIRAARSWVSGVQFPLRCEPLWISWSCRNHVNKWLGSSGLRQSNAACGCCSCSSGRGSGSFLVCEAKIREAKDVTGLWFVAQVGQTRAEQTDRHNPAKERGKKNVLQALIADRQHTIRWCRASGAAAAIVRNKWTSQCLFWWDDVVDVPVLT